MGKSRWRVAGRLAVASGWGADRGLPGEETWRKRVGEGEKRRKGTEVSEHAPPGEGSSSKAALGSYRCVSVLVVTAAMTTMMMMMVVVVLVVRMSEVVQVGGGKRLRAAMDGCKSAAKRQCSVQ